MQGKQYQTQSLCLRFPLALVSVDSEMPPQPHQCLVVRFCFVWFGVNKTKQNEDLLKPTAKVVKGLILIFHISALLPKLSTVKLSLPYGSTE